MATLALCPWWARLRLGSTGGRDNLCNYLPDKHQKGQMKADFSNIYNKHFIVCLVIEAIYYIKLFGGSDTFFWHFN